MAALGTFTTNLFNPVQLRASGGNATISGTVTAKDGNPRGVVAELWSQYDRVVVASTEADASGAYSFSGVAEGRYEIRFRHPTRKYRTRVVHVGTSDVRVAAPAKTWFTHNLAHPVAFTSSSTATYSIASGSLSPGHSLSATGAVTGTPTGAGEYAVIVKAETADADYYVPWRYRVDAWFLCASYTGESGANGRVYRVGSLTDVKTWEDRQAAVDLRGAQFNSMEQLDSTQFVMNNSSNTWKYSNDGGYNFSHSVSADFAAASNAGRWVKNPVTGTLIRTRGSTSGAPPHVATRYPPTSIFAGTPSTSSAAGSVATIIALSTGRLLATANDRSILGSDDDGATWTLRGQVVTGATGSATGAPLAVDGSVILCVAADGGPGASDPRYIRRSTDGGATWTTVHTFTGTFAVGEVGNQLAGGKGSGKWIAMLSGTPTKYAYSSDNGLTWTQSTLTNVLATTIPGAGLAYNRALDQFAYISAVPSASDNTIYTSSDMINWTARSDPFTTMAFSFIASLDP